MGLPMATRLTADHEVAGFDVSPERRRLAAESGVRATDTAVGAASGAGVVVIGVRHAGQLEEVLFGPDGVVPVLESGSVVVLTSTVGADVAVSAAQRLGGPQRVRVAARASGGPTCACLGNLHVIVSV